MSGATQDVFSLADLENWEEATMGLGFPPRLAVIGDPVAHSRSPQMHNPALRAAGIDASYIRVHLRPEQLDEGIRRMMEAGFLGFNATIPHKGAVFERVDEMTETARRVGAVNTVAFREGRLFGHNTDAPGLQRAVKEAFGADFSDLRILIVGAGGGAGRAAAVQAAMEGCRRLVLVNRTLAKAGELAEEIADLLPGDGRLVAIPWDEEHLERELEATDLIVNATSLGMKPEDQEVVPERLLRDGHLVYDMVYAPPRTRLLDAAVAAGARGTNGLDMLLWQGALAFEFWFGGQAPVAEMRRGLHGE